MNRSLNFRLLLSASIVLASFFALAGIALDHAFKDGAKKAVQERLQIHIYALLSAADLSLSGEIRLPDTLPEARFSNPGSGLYGFVFGSNGETRWQSKSSLMFNLHPLNTSVAGESQFIELEDKFVLYYPIMWESILGTEKKYLFAAAEDSGSYVHQVSAFRHTLWLWFGGIGLVLIVAQISILRWSLKPLRLMGKDLEDIEAGKKQHLDDDYPKELRRLALDLNALIDNERTHLERYRNTLADLAHSLKTPLAILRGIQENEGIAGESRQTLKDQVSRMDNLVEYQLQRAAAQGHKQLSSSVNVVDVINKIISSLNKVYANKGVDCRLRKNRSGQFFCEEGDLFEIVGNLLDNAYKWCAGSVEVTVEFAKQPGKKRNAIQLVVEDDGPGVPQEKFHQVLKRGIRADERTQGHGIGLAVVSEIVRLSRGTLNLNKSRLGGARFEVHLPALI